MVQEIELDRTSSDLSATTGVLHRAMAHFAPKVRQPTAVLLGCGPIFPEVRKLPAVFRRGNFSFVTVPLKIYDVGQGQPTPWIMPTPPHPALMCTGRLPECTNGKYNPS